MRMMIILLLACSSHATERIPNTRIGKGGCNGRLEILEMKLKASDLVPGTPLTGDVKNHVLNSMAPGDVIGVLIDEKLGGPGNETFNALPMNPSTQNIWNTKVIDATYDYLLANKSGELVLSLMPFYYSECSSRPYGISVYVTKASNENEILLKGYISNPAKRESKTVVSYTYSAPLWTENRENESFAIVGVEGDHGRMQRVELASKYVRLSDLTTGTEIDEITRNNTQKLAGNSSPGSYVPGLLLSQKLGGKGDELYNVVPMHPKALEELESQLETPILAFFSVFSNRHRTVHITVTVMYADHTSTRPVGFVVLSPNCSMFIPNQDYPIP